MKPSSKTKDSILIVAGEASSSLYAQRLLEQMNSNGLSVHCFGVGSKEMETLGFERLGKSEEMAVVGFQEVLVHYKDIKGVFNQLVEQAKVRRPKVALLLDYPDFNLRLAKQLKKIGIPVVYYISPQLWAWRTSRINIIKKYVDKMLVLFPFEEVFYKKHDVDALFVGHPLLNEIHSEFFTESYLHGQRQRFGLTVEDKVLGIMPGSRKSEIKHHLQVQLQVAKQMQIKDPKLKIHILVAPTFSVEEFKSFIEELNIKFNYTLIKDTPFEMIHMQDAILTASGTATLMVGLMLKPMVIMYKVNAFTGWIFKKMVGKKTPYFGMINLILEKLAVPELFQEEASVDRITAELSKVLYDKTNYDQIVENLRPIHSLLGNKGATSRVLDVVKGYLE